LKRRYHHNDDTNVKKNCAIIPKTPLMDMVQRVQEYISAADKSAYFSSISLGTSTKEKQESRKMTKDKFPIKVRSS
jgi:hypothetical protein